nr:hypothetical protein BaRGS_004600 [Batillaria attramentaria]
MHARLLALKAGKADKERWHDLAFKKFVVKGLQEESQQRLKLNLVQNLKDEVFLRLFQNPSACLFWAMRNPVFMLTGSSEDGGEFFQCYRDSNV